MKRQRTCLEPTQNQPTPCETSVHADVKTDEPLASGSIVETMALKKRVEDLSGLADGLISALLDVNAEDALDEQFVIYEFCRDCINTRDQCDCKYPNFVGATP